MKSKFKKLNEQEIIDICIAHTELVLCFVNQGFNWFDVSYMDDEELDRAIGEIARVEDEH